MLSIVATIVLGGNDADTVAMSMIDTCRFVFLFVGGIVIAAHASRLKGAVSRLPSPLVPLLVAVAAALLLFPGPSYSRAYNFVWGAGAAGLVILAIGSARVDRVLISSPLLWLGRVSYSLYLIHVPILIATVHLTWGVLPLWLTLTGVVVLSLVIAEAMYRLIEEPSIRLGRFLTKPGLPAGVPLAIPARREDRR
jgi:peptidoglycan/LPS O-acetylase OafA/YrhL